jgi:60kDa lysophospholipase
MKAHKTLNPNVGVLRLFPSITEAVIKSFLLPPIQGVILHTFGVGNAPTRHDLIDALKEASDRGVIIVNITQCRTGSVSDAYATGKALSQINVIPGFDMTLECALTKLSFLLGRSYSAVKVRQLMATCLRGELTSFTPERKFSFKNPNFTHRLAEALHANPFTDSPIIEKSLYPIIFLSAASFGEIAEMEKLLTYSNWLTINTHDHLGRTALHIASLHGHQHMVEWLLRNGANVHLRDSLTKTPVNL